MHLARLADGYPACRECPCRDGRGGAHRTIQEEDTGAGGRGRGPADFLTDEGVWGELHNGFDSILAGRFAAGFGMLLREKRSDRGEGVFPGVARPQRTERAVDPEALRPDRGAVAVAPAATWSNWGRSPALPLLRAMGETKTDGGIYLGNPQGDPHRAGMRFYGQDGRPITGVASLQAVSARVEQEPVRLGSRLREGRTGGGAGFLHIAVLGVFPRASSLSVSCSTRVAARWEVASSDCCRRLRAEWCCTRVKRR